MVEADYKLAVMIALEGVGFKCQAHEDRLTKYIPDMSFAGHGVDGWVEVKYHEQAPRSLVDIHHWTPGQQQWLEDFGRVGSGHCYLLVGIGGGHHFMWHHTCLGKVRLVSFENAVEWACLRSHSLTQFCARFVALTRRAGG